MQVGERPAAKTRRKCKLQTANFKFNIRSLPFAILLTFTGMFLRFMEIILTSVVGANRGVFAPRPPFQNTRHRTPGKYKSFFGNQERILLARCIETLDRSVIEE